MKLQRSKPYNILILTGSIGSGHLSVARAIADALYRMNVPEIRVEIVDFLTTLKNFATTATKKIYLGSLKISPKIYEMLFSQTSEKEWPLKLLNSISTPFLQRKFLKLMREIKPSILVSTFPVWQIVMKKAWERYAGKAPFVSVITDSMFVHNSWVMGNPDFFIVSNDDTKVSLQHYGISSRRIRVFGYPIDQCFFKESSAVEFQKKWNLSPKRKTLLLILSPAMRWSRVKKIAETTKQSTVKNIQLLIVAHGKNRWQKKLQKMHWPWPTRITGWSKNIHTLIHGSDIVLTKAGGATVMECIHSQKPIIIIEAIPGQEIGNALLVQKYNVGAVLNNDLSDFDKVLRYILSHESLIEKNLAAQQKPHAAEEIAKFLVGLVKKT